MTLKSDFYDPNISCFNGKAVNKLNDDVVVNVSGNDKNLNLMPIPSRLNKFMPKNNNLTLYL